MIGRDKALFRGGRITFVRFPSELPVIVPEFSSVCVVYFYFESLWCKLRAWLHREKNFLM